MASTRSRTTSPASFCRMTVFPPRFLKALPPLDSASPFAGYRRRAAAATTGAIADAFRTVGIIVGRPNGRQAENPIKSGTYAHTAYHREHKNLSRIEVSRAL